MSSTNLYRKFIQNDVLENQDGGYKNVIYFAPASTFSSVKQPTESAVLGDTEKVILADTFNDDEGYISMLSKLHSVTTRSETVGEEGAQSLQHTFEAIILGDSPAHLAQLKARLNEGAIWLVKDQNCLNATDFIRFGDDCLQPNIKIDFTGNTTASGLKEYKITGTIRNKKFFYSGTVTEKPAGLIIE